MTDAAEQESLGDQDVMAIISSLKDKSFRIAVNSPNKPNPL
jgi:hypothetical protein